MEIVSTLLPWLTVILDLIDSSSETESHLDRGLNFGSHHSGPPCSSTPLSSPDPASPPPPAVPPLRDPSESPTLRETFPSILGYQFEDLDSIRLIPHNNPNRIFELRRYVFPPDKPIGLRTKSRVLNLMPTSEQIVLSTSNGDVFAILGKSSSRNTILRAIFTPVHELSARAKINMNSGEVKVMTPEEVADCPVSIQKLIAKSYRVLRSGLKSRGLPDGNLEPGLHRCGPSPSSPPPPYGENRPYTTLSLANPHYTVGSLPPSGLFLRNRSRSPPLRQTFTNILGFKLEDLAFIRLTPHNYLNRIFELRRYIFPLDKPIGLRRRNHVLDPMPTGEQIVLSTFNADVFAILGKSLSKNTILRPIFATNFGILERVKININSGAVGKLTSGEISECPVTHKDAITKSYRVFRV